MLFTKILVAVDGSKHSHKAAEYARGIARTQKADLVLLYCPGHIPNLVGGHAREKLKQELQEEGQQIIDKFADLCEGHDLCYNRVVISGNPADTIVRYAEENGFDLIVMGSRGLSDIEGIFMGSVTHHVLQRTHCPVLIIR